VRDADLFQLALGFAPPWKVMTSDFDARSEGNG
jgi:hypothetical protein